MSTAEVPREKKMNNVFIFMDDFKLYAIEHISLNGSHTHSVCFFPISLGYTKPLLL